MVILLFGFFQRASIFPKASEIFVPFRWRNATFCLAEKAFLL